MEWAIIFATLLGPILAVQAQRYLEVKREQEARRLAVYRTLMATRMAMLSGSHVEALNAVPIEFYGKKQKYRDVVTSWKAYVDHLSQQQIEQHVWAQKRYDLFIEMLWRMSVALRYQFSKVELQREVYSPKAHGAMEADQDAIRVGLAQLFRGELALPLDIKAFPVDPSAAEKQLALWGAATAFLTGNQSVKVQTSPEPQKQRGQSKAQ